MWRYLSHEHQYLDKIFDRFDQDSSGSLDEAEVAKLLTCVTRDLDVSAPVIRMLPLQPGFESLACSPSRVCR